MVDRKHAKKLGTTTEDTSALTAAQLNKEKLAKQQALEKEVQELKIKQEEEERKAQQML